MPSPLHTESFPYGLKPRTQEYFVLHSLSRLRCTEAVLSKVSPIFRYGFFRRSPNRKKAYDNGLPATVGVSRCRCCIPHSTFFSLAGSEPGTNLKSCPKLLNLHTVPSVLGRTCTSHLFHLVPPQSYISTYWTKSRP
ncbi:hypothetical protein LshimejAT787_0200330 [Lyophyllum shimeji]|uniref:Uncharacterized protein n=1 Tax=Lyophyllum shimeji TaxID=47721 RepID=A0A9P3PEK0_LYOSH|nr:hypothetical protein LshimejAT787_0200330 [Lyophyllum shimeji]